MDLKNSFFIDNLFIDQKTDHSESTMEPSPYHASKEVPDTSKLFYVYSCAVGIDLVV